MHFIKSFVSALLVTSAVGQYAQVIRSNDQLGLSVRAPAKAPAKGTSRISSASYCSKPYKKGGKGDVEERNLEIRAKPAGYTDVQMGHSQGASATQAGLYSGMFGTCPGVVVTGRVRKADGITRFIFHLSLGANFAQGQQDFNAFATTVQNAGMTSMQGWFYTVDTRSSNPEVSGDPDMQQMAADLDVDYTRLRALLQNLVGSRGTVTPAYHPFGSVGEITVSPKGRLLSTTSPRSVASTASAMC